MTTKRRFWRQGATSPKSELTGVDASPEPAAAIAMLRRFRQRVSRSLRRRHDFDAVGIPGPPRPVEIPRIKDAAIRQLLLGFESVGSDCEFGMVQRHYFAEPLGLLRWSFVPFANLMSALEAGLSGIGDPEHTTLWYAEDGSETFIADKRWGLHLHTFIKKAEVNETTFFPKACRRRAYLRKRFLADLAGGEKVVVFKSADIGIDGMQLLHAALQKFGKVRLLCVVPASADLSVTLRGEPGCAYAISEGLYVGFIRRYGNMPDGSWDIAFDDWIAVCRAVDDESYLAREQADKKAADLKSIL